MAAVMEMVGNRANDARPHWKNENVSLQVSLGLLRDARRLAPRLRLLALVTQEGGDSHTDANISKHVAADIAPPARGSDAPELAAERQVYHDHQWRQLQEAQAEIARLTAALAEAQVMKQSLIDQMVAMEDDHTAREQRAREEEREAILGIVRGAVMNLDAQAVLIQAIEARARSTP